MSRGEAITNPDYMGQHVLCDVKLNSNHNDLIEIIEKGIELSSMNVVAKKIEKFKPFGVSSLSYWLNLIFDKILLKERDLPGITAFWILSESHFSLHTYPESNYITMCCYTCGSEGDPESAMQHILSKLDVKDFKMKLVERGKV